MEIEEGLEADAVHILSKLPDISVVQSPQPGPTDVSVIYSNAGKHVVHLEFKRRVNAANVWHLARLRDMHEPRQVVVVASEATSEAKRVLVDHQIGFIDADGNAHIELPGLLFHREVPPSKRARSSEATPVRISGKAALVAQALLLGSDRRWHVTEIAAEARVSTALAHRVLRRLEDEQVVSTHGSGPGRVRVLQRAGGLLDLWAEENNDRERRIRAFTLTRTTTELTHRLSQDLESGGIAHALTGPAAARLLSPFVTSIPVVTVWVTEAESTDHVFDVTGSEPAETGYNIVFRQTKSDVALAFRRRETNLWIVNPFRLYVDLLGEPQRGEEQAERLRKEVLGI